MVVDPMMSREEEGDGVIRPPRDDNDHDDYDDNEVGTTTAPRKTKDGTSPFLFHDPRQFIEYCLCTLYSASQLDSSSSSSSTTGHGDFHPAIRREWKEMISEKIADALQQDPTLAGAEFQTQQQQNMPHQPLLHWVCHFGLTLELIRYISRLCPSAIMHSRVGDQDHYCYPIAQALQNYDTPMETIIFLLFHEDDDDDDENNDNNNNTADDDDHDLDLDLDHDGRRSRRRSRRRRRNYPQATIHSILRRVLTRYPLSDALPLLKRFLPNDAQQRDFFSSSIANHNNHNHNNHNHNHNNINNHNINNSIQFEYGYNHDIAADLLSYVAKLHGQSEYTWVFAAATSTVGRTGMLSIQVVVEKEEEKEEEKEVDTATTTTKTKTKTTIRVAVGSEYEIPRVIPRLLQIPDLHMVAIESPRISHCCWIQDFCNLLLVSSSSSSASSSSSKNNNHLTNENENENDSSLRHVVPPPLVLAGAFGSVRSLSIRFQALTCETMDKLLVSIHSAMPNLRHLSLHNAWHGKLTESTGYAKLPLLFAANNNSNNNNDNNDDGSSSSTSLLLEEIQVVGDPLAWPYIMALLQRSTTLRKLEFIDKTFVMDADQAIELASVLRNNKILQELHVDSQFQDMSSFEATLIESLNINTTLKVLRLPQLLMINNNNNKDPASSGRNQAGEDDLLVDLVRLQKNTTLEKIVVGSTSTTTTTTTTDDTRNDMLQYWCSRNRLLTSLYDESLRLQEAIVIATPYHLFDDLPSSCNEDPTTTTSSTATTTTKENTAVASVSSSAEQLPSSSSRRRSCIISGVKRPRATTGGTTTSSTGTTQATTTPSAPSPPAALLLEDSYRCSLAYEMIRCRPDLWRVQQEEQQQQQQQLVKKPPPTPPPPPPPTSSSCATGLPNENNHNSARVS